MEISLPQGCLFPWGWELPNKNDINFKWHLLSVFSDYERKSLFVTIIYQRKLNLLVFWSLFQTVLVKGTSDLLTYIEASQLTPSFGGTLSYDHKAWIKLQKVLKVLHLSLCFPLKRKVGNLVAQWFRCKLCSGWTALGLNPFPGSFSYIHVEETSGPLCTTKSLFWWKVGGDTYMNLWLTSIPSNTE